VSKCRNLGTTVRTNSLTTRYTPRVPGRRWKGGRSMHRGIPGNQASATDHVRIVLNRFVQSPHAAAAYAYAYAYA